MAADWVGGRGGGKVTAAGVASVAVGGNVNSPVTTNVFIGQYVALQDAWLDPDMIFDDVRVDRFVGREWLTRAIDQFISGNDHGYIIVEAGAGMGKTSFAARLAAERGYPAHFSTHLNGGMVSVALRNLAAQLIAVWQLDDFIHGGRLPEISSEPAWLERLLRAAGAAALKTSQRAVIVVDGLDEASTIPNALPFGLPRRLPPGVIIIATCRTGTQLAGLAQPYEILRITADDRNNLADVRDFLNERMNDGTLASFVASDIETADHYITEISLRCGGIWIYLRCLLDEIESGHRNLGELDGIPDGLGEYYRLTIAPLRADAAWTAAYLPLLATLAVAREPVTLDILRRLAGIDRPEDAHRMCYGQIRSFLSVTPAPDGPQFSLLHASFREFLAGQHGGAATGYGEDIVSELGAAARMAHRRIADLYLAHFGGLDSSLAELARDLGRAASDHGYPLRHLVYHLQEAGRKDDLHRLLACGLRGLDGRTRNIWFEAQDFGGNLDQYLLDLEQARSIAVSETDDQLAAGLPAGTFTLELRYTLMGSSVRGLAGYVPPSLLARLVAAGHWTAGKALSWARRLERPGSRARAYAALLPYVPESDRPALIETALNEALAAGGAPRVQALKAIAPYLSSDQIRRAWAAAVEDIYAAGGPQVLANRLQPESVRETFTAIEEGRFSDQSTAHLLELLANQLPDELIVRAWTVGLRVNVQEGRMRALLALIPRLPQEELIGFYDKQILDGGILPPSLNAAIAVRLTGLQRDRAIAAAFSVAISSEGSGHGGALEILAAHLPTEQLRDAVLAATRITSPAGRALQLNSLRRYMSPELAAEAISALSRTDDGWHYGVAAILPAAAAHVQQELLPMLISPTASDRGSQPDKGLIFKFLVSHFPLDALRGLIDSALAVADDLDKSMAIALTAPYLTPAQLARVLDDIANMGKNGHFDPESWIRLDSLERVAPFLPTELLPKAVECAAQLADGDACADASVAMAPYLDSAECGKLFGRALQWAPIQLPWSIAMVDLAEPVSWPDVIERLAPYLPQDELLKAVGELCQITHSRDRLYALKAIASRLKPEFVNRASREVKSWRDAYTRAIGLIYLLPRVASARKAAIMDDIVSAIRDITDDSQRLEATGRVIEHLDRVQGEQAIQDIETITSGMALKKRCHCLITVVSVVCGHWREPLVRSTLAAIAQVETEADRAEMMGKLARYLTDGTAEQAMTAIRDMTGGAFIRAARAVIPHVPNALLFPDAAAPSDARWGQAEILPLLVSRASPDMRTHMLAAMLTTAQENPDGFPWRSSITEAGAILSPQQLDTAADAASRINNTYDQIEALAVLIPYLPPQRQDQLLDAAFTSMSHIDDTRGVPYLLGGLVKSRPDSLKRAMEVAATFYSDAPADVVAASASALTSFSAGLVHAAVSTSTHRNARVAVIGALAPIAGKRWDLKDITELIRIAIKSMPRATVLRCLAIAHELIVLIAGRDAAQRCVDDIATVQQWYR